LVYDLEGGGFATPKSKEVLQNLEKRRRKLLDDREVVWFLKIHAICLEYGDENKNSFRCI
jgi:hypothetical protein